MKENWIVVLIAGIMIFGIFPVSFADSDITLKTDLSIYFFRDAIVLDGTVDRIIDNEDDVLIEIINPAGKVVNKRTIELDRETRQFFQNIPIVEHFWAPDGLYRIQATYEGLIGTTYFHVFQQKTGIPNIIESTVGLNKEVYSWTDTVEVFVVAPSFDRETHVEYIGIGTEKQGTIEIRTGFGKLNNYRLEETDVSSGIFYGRVHLTGDPSRDINKNNKQDDASGTNSGNGPFDGLLRAYGNDQITITFTNIDESIEYSSKIEWQVGEIIWTRDFFIPSSSAKIRVNDPDMNLKYDVKDYLSVLVSTDTDQESRLIKLVETGLNTGIFSHQVTLSTETSSLIKFRVTNNDQLHVNYVDSTVPFSVSPTRELLIKSSIPIHFEPVALDSTLTSEFEPTPKILKPDLDLIQTGTNELFGTISIESTEFETFPGRTTLLEIKGNVNPYTKGGAVYVTISGPNDFVKENKVRVGNSKQFISYINLDSKFLPGIYTIIASSGPYTSETLRFELKQNLGAPIGEKHIVIPDWIKNTARWWSSGQISDSDFTEGLQYLIKQGTMKVRQDIQVSEKSDAIPDWVKNNAKWWADGLIDNNDFVRGIEYLIEKGIIKI